jgi:hypothetical protein
MDERLIKPPPGVSLGPLSAEVFAILAEYTAFPWPVLKTQATRHDFDPTNLTAQQLRAIAGLLADGVARFTSPGSGAKVRDALQELLARLPT